MGRGARAGMFLIAVAGETLVTPDDFFAKYGESAEPIELLVIGDGGRRQSVIVK